MHNTAVIIFFISLSFLSILGIIGLIYGILQGVCDIILERIKGRALV